MSITYTNLNDRWGGIARAQMVDAPGKARHQGVPARAPNRSAIYRACLPGMKGEFTAREFATFVIKRHPEALDNNVMTWLAHTAAAGRDVIVVKKSNGWHRRATYRRKTGNEIRSATGPADGTNNTAA